MLICCFAVLSFSPVAVFNESMGAKIKWKSYCVVKYYSTNLMRWSWSSQRTNWFLCGVTEKGVSWLNTPGSCESIWQLCWFPRYSLFNLTCKEAQLRWHCAQKVYYITVSLLFYIWFCWRNAMTNLCRNIVNFVLWNVLNILCAPHLCIPY